MDKTFIGGYWSTRTESINEVASKIVLFLKELEAVNELFSALKLPDNTKKKALNNNFEVNDSNLIMYFKRNRKAIEIDEQGFCKIGFSISLFNEISESISLSVNFSIGASSNYFKNNCYVKILGKNLKEDERNKTLNLIIDIFNPETIKND